MQVTLSTEQGLTQTEETLTVVHEDGSEETMRLHEYDRVYAIPGLYEHVVYERLECLSARILADRLVEQVAADGGSPADLRVLDLGAGNGVVGEELRERGVTGTLIGLDPTPAAAPAAERDRPGLYAEFLSMTLDEADVDRLVRTYDVNAIVGAGALGMGHMSREEIESAWNALPSGSYLAVTFHEDVMTSEGEELHEFVEDLRAGEDATEVRVLERFRHRLSMSGDEIFYYVLVARRSD